MLDRRDQKPHFADHTAHVVCVHGIFSDAKTFDPMIAMLGAEPERAYGLWTYEYDWTSSILANASALSVELTRAFAPGHEVTLVGHSMGGLVCRFAYLQHATALQMVQRIFMLGTPNNSAVAVENMGLLSAALYHSTMSLNAFYCRSHGVLDLTRVESLFDQVSFDKVLEARNVEYITVPGIYFHRERGSAGVSRAATGSAGFSLLRVMLDLGEINVPGFRIEIDMPHDGIVEEDSVNLIGKAERGFEGAPENKTFHVTPLPHAKEWTHLQVHCAPVVAELVHSILTLGGAEAWAAKIRKGKGKEQTRFNVKRDS